MEAAVNVEHFACAEGEEILGDGSHCFAHVLRSAPALDWRQAFGDEFVIFVFHRAGHVKDKYAKLIAEGLTPIQRWGTPEDVGKAEGGFGDAVIAAIGGSG